MHIRVGRGEGIRLAEKRCSKTRGGGLTQIRWQTRGGGCPKTVGIIRCRLWMAPKRIYFVTWENYPLIILNGDCLMREFFTLKVDKNRETNIMPYRCGLYVIIAKSMYFVVRENYPFKILNWVCLMREFFILKIDKNRKTNIVSYCCVSCVIVVKRMYFISKEKITSSKS